MFNFINFFINNIKSIIDIEEYESYILARSFLEYSIQENIKSLCFDFMNFTNIEKFLKTIEVLYTQKLTHQKILVLFNEIFYPEFINIQDDMRKKILSLVVSKTKKIIIKNKKIQAYTKIIERAECYKPFDICNIFIKTYNSNRITTITEFTEITEKFIVLSNHYNVKNSINIQNLNLDKLNIHFANLFIVIILKIKEESVTHHNQYFNNQILLWKTLKK